MNAHRVRPNSFTVASLGQSFHQSFDDFPEPEEVHYGQYRGHQEQAIEAQVKNLFHLGTINKTEISSALQ